MPSSTPTRGPLSGVRVLEFASMLSGPYAGLLLHLLGAEVIKVERVSGDPFRGYGGYSTHFANFNSGKKSVAVDLNDPAGREAVLALIAQSDVVLENSRPGQMERLGLGEDDCRVANPAIVYVGISGFGMVGPLADRPAYDAIGQSVSGLMASITNGAPPSVGPALGDVVSGLVGASAVMAGLVGRGLRTDGFTVRTSMMEALGCAISDAMLHFAAHGTERTREDRATRSQVFSLPCADGRYVMIQLSNSQKFFVNLVNSVGRPDLAVDERFSRYDGRMANHAVLEGILSEVFSGRPSAEWEGLLSDADVPASTVLSVADVVSHPQTEALETLGPVESDGLRRYRGPWTIDGRRPDTPGPAPSLGADTRSVFEGVLGAEAASDLIRRAVLIANE